MSKPVSQLSKLPEESARELERLLATPDFSLADATNWLVANFGVDVSATTVSNWRRARERKRSQDAALERFLAHCSEASQRADAVVNKLPLSEVSAQLRMHVGQAALEQLLEMQAMPDLKSLQVLNEIGVSSGKLEVEQARLAEAKAARELDERRFQRETCRLFIQWAENEEARKTALGGGDNSEKIERLGQLMFGEGWRQ